MDPKRGLGSLAKRKSKLSSRTDAGSSAKPSGQGSTGKRPREEEALTLSKRTRSEDPAHRPSSALDVSRKVGTSTAPSRPSSSLVAIASGSSGSASPRRASSPATWAEPTSRPWVPIFAPDFLRLVLVQLKKHVSEAFSSKVGEMELMEAMDVAIGTASRTAVACAAARNQMYRFMREQMAHVEQEREKGENDAEEVKTLKKALKDLQIDFEKLQSKY